MNTIPVNEQHKESSIMVNSAEQLTRILEQIQTHLLHSEESHWAAIPLSELLGTVAANIESLRQQATCSHHLLTELFLPTGALQETAKDNGWETEYIHLSSAFDAVIHCVSNAPLDALNSGDM
jgi:hypothetical protein